MSTKVKIILGVIGLIIFGQVLQVASKTPTYKTANQSDYITSQPTTAQSTPTIQPKQRTLYDVVKVIDGDTIDVSIDGNTQRIRLIGVDTPETVDPRKPVQCFGQEASAKMHKLLDGAKVSLETDQSQGDKDKYDRLLRYVFTEDNINVAHELILSGFAYEYTYNAPYKYQKEFKEAQQFAEKNTLGLWAPDACVTPTQEIIYIPPANTPAPQAPVYTDQTTSNTQTSSSSFTCSGKTKCGDMVSCEEARFYYTQCGVGRLDGDKDGVPCEDLCN